MITCVSKNFSELKREIVHQGKSYTSHAVNFRSKIAELTLGFIKDDSVVRFTLIERLGVS
jgi:translation initiation factor eIF-2B subunit alpha